jgi:hypothetical protein
MIKLSTMFGKPPKTFGQSRQALVQRPKLRAGRDQNRGQQLQIN